MKENEVNKWLLEVEHPAKGDKNVVELGMVEKVEIGEGSVTVTLAFSKHLDPLAEYLIGSAKAAIIRNAPAGTQVEIKTIIKDEEVRQAYHDITYYLRWNEPQSIQTLISNYKNSLESALPNSSDLIAVIQKIRTDCEKVITLKDSEIHSDRLLYTDIAPWLHTLHTYSIVIEKMLGILDNQENGHVQNWLSVKEVSDSLISLDNSTLYTAYALEGMGNSISVSSRQAQLSRLYLYPFISYLKENNRGYTVFEGHGSTDKMNMIFIVLPRREMPKALKEIRNACENKVFVVASEVSKYAGGYGMVK